MSFDVGNFVWINCVIDCVKFSLITVNFVKGKVLNDWMRVLYENRFTSPHSLSLAAAVSTYNETVTPVPWVLMMQ